MLQSHSSTRSRMLLLCATVMVVGLSACSRDAPAPLAVAPAAAATVAAPVVIQQAAAPSSGMGNMLVGAAIGSLATHALTSNRSGGAAPPPTSAPVAAPPVINKTVIHKTTIVQAPPVPAPPAAAPPGVSLVKSTAPAPRVSAASYRPSSSYRSTTTTVRYAPSTSRK